MEDSVVVIDHRVSYYQLELAPLKLVAHNLRVFLHLLEPLHDPTDLTLLLTHLSPDFRDLSLQSRLHLLFLSQRHAFELLMALNVPGNDLILLVDGIDLSIEHVDIIVEGIVLLLGLNEGCHDLLNILNARRLSDLVERVLDHLYIPHVHVAEMFLLTVVLGPAVESQFKDCGRVGELLGASSLLVLWIRLLLIVLLIHCQYLKTALLLLLEPLLEPLDLGLETELPVLVIGLQCQDLIVGLLGHPLSRVHLLVKTAGLICYHNNVCHDGFVSTYQVSVLLSHDINLEPKVAVACLQLRVAEHAGLQLILHHLDLDAILAHLSGGWAHLL